MNLLELVNRARMECGVSGPQLANLMVPSLETQRIRGWVIDAWRDIQTMKDDWNFMRKPIQFNTIANKQVYTPAEAGVPNFANWKLDSFRCATDPQLIDEQLLAFLPFDQFRNLYQYGPNRTNATRPVTVTVTPEKFLAFGPVPDGQYPIVAEYYTAPVFLALDTDSPAFPERFHMLLVFMAMKYYGAYESAPEVYQRGQEMSNKMMGELMINELPTIMMSAPLV